MLQADKHNSAASVIIRFSDGDARHSEGEAGTIIPEACRVAAPRYHPQGGQFREEHWQEPLGVKSEDGNMSAHHPLERCHPHGHGTARKAGDAVELRSRMSRIKGRVDLGGRSPGCTTRVKTTYRLEGLRVNKRDSDNVTSETKPMAQKDTDVRR